MTRPAERVTEPGTLLALAEGIAREAGAHLREAFARLAHGELRISAKSTPTDLVSEADVSTEQLIRARLHAARPDDAVRGEEGGDQDGTSGLRWVVDPLDGTVNFLFGIPQWCVSIACEDAAGGGVVGVVYDPMREELWSATRASGAALLNGEPVRASARADLATAMIATGFGYDADVRAVQGALVAELLPRVRDIRRLGSAALDLAWVAGGRYDAYYERGVNHWDIAAGAVLCESAGLELRELAPMPPAGAGILVAPSELAGRLHELVG